MRTVVALYDTLDDAQRAVQALRDAGFHSEDINFIARDTNDEYSQYLNRNRGQAVQNAGDTPAEGAAAGAGIGAVLGGLGGLLLGLSAFAIPGVGPVIGAGAIASALAGAGVGAVAGGLVGGLVDMGIPKEHAQIYAEGIRQGGTLVTVRADDETAEQARTVLNRFNPVDIDTRAQNWRQNNWTGFDENAQPMTPSQADYNRATNVPVTGSDVERDLNRDMGTNQDVSTHRDWSSSPSGMSDSETDTGDLPNQEDYRRNQDWNQSDSSTPRAQNRDVNAPLGQDMLDDDDDEGLGLNKPSGQRGSGWDQNTNWNQQSGQDMTDAPFGETTSTGGMGSMNQNAGAVNRSNIPVTGGEDMGDTEGVDDEDLDDTFDNSMDTGMSQHLNQDVFGQGQTQGDVINMPVTGGTYEEAEEIDIVTPQSDWDNYDTQFNQDYQTRYGMSGRGYDYYQPAYRFGYDLANNPNYRGYDWTRMEPVAQQEYQRRGLRGAWEDVKDAVQHAWDSVTGH